MISWFLLVAAAASTTNLPNPKANHLENVRRLCADEWKDNFSMQEYCIKQQREGALEFSRLYKEFSGDKKEIEPALEKCIADWSKGDLVNWMMVAYCSKQQIEAYHRLKH